MTVKVFISWSGDRSYKVARKLEVWLPEVIKEVEPLISVKPEAGGLVFTELNNKLRQADIAVLCLTPENWYELWLSYEAGMVYGRTETLTKICPYVIDAKCRDLPTPLSHFTCLKDDEDGTKLLVEAIATAAGKRPKSAKLKKSFDSKWPELEAFLDQIGRPKTPPDPKTLANDFMKVSGYIEKHRSQLEGPLRDLILKTVDNFMSDKFDLEKAISLADRAIQKSKNSFRGKKSILVGNVTNFFKKNFTQEELREIVTDLESYITLDPDETRRRLTDRVLRILSEVFAHFHRKLLDRLDECLNAAN
ncbi:MAG TPA: hypothetical protein VJS44_17615 [Pyrinomonadaceae bacterium]|nr:hypothetical protein [Pyrinomonadaceae bacterium]